MNPPLRNEPLFSAHVEKVLRSMRLVATEDDREVLNLSAVLALDEPIRLHPGCGEAVHAQLSRVLAENLSSRDFMAWAEKQWSTSAYSLAVLKIVARKAAEEANQL